MVTFGVQSFLEGVSRYRLTVNQWAMLLVLQRRREISGQGQAISIIALSRSLAQPYETTRRHAAVLIARGFAERPSRDGLVLGGSVISSPDIQAERTLLWRNFSSLIDDLADLGFNFGASHPVATAEASEAYPHPPIATLGLEPGPADHRMLDFVLKLFVLAGEMHGNNVERAVLYYLVMAGNAAHLNQDSALAWAFGRSETPPPDALRRPVKLGIHADPLGLSKETVRRYALRMVEAGQIRHVPGEGYVALNSWMQSEAMLRSGVNVNIAFHRLIADLKRLGVVLA